MQLTYAIPPFIWRKKNYTRFVPQICLWARLCCLVSVLMQHMMYSLVLQRNTGMASNQLRSAPVGLHLYCLSVDFSTLQVAILARSSWEMSETVRIEWKHILSRVRVSVRPSNVFIREKHPKLLRIPSRMRYRPFITSEPAKRGR